jgi:hypothetical protein
MALPKLESFTDTDGTLLTTHDAGWINHTTGSASAMSINQNTERPTVSSTDTFYYWNTDTPNAD